MIWGTLAPVSVSYSMSIWMLISTCFRICWRPLSMAIWNRSRSIIYYSTVWYWNWTLSINISEPEKPISRLTSFNSSLSSFYKDSWISIRRIRLIFKSIIIITIITRLKRKIEKRRMKSIERRKRRFNSRVWNVRSRVRMWFRWSILSIILFSWIQRRMRKKYCRVRIYRKGWSSCSKQKWIWISRRKMRVKS